MGTDIIVVTPNHHFKYFNHIQLFNTHIIPSVTDLLDFMYFINVNILESKHVHSICWLDLLEGLMMTVLKRPKHVASYIIK